MVKSTSIKEEPRSLELVLSLYLFFLSQALPLESNLNINGALLYNSDAL